MVSWQNCSRKTDQLAKPGNSNVHRYCMSVAFLFGAIKWDRPSVIFWTTSYVAMCYSNIHISYCFKKVTSNSQIT